jgi:hypothetical protein
MVGIHLMYFVIAGASYRFLCGWLPLPSLAETEL